MLGRPLAWPWLPILSLPLALLASPASSPTLPLLPLASWPLRVGLGGAVGDLQWRWLEPELGPARLRRRQPRAGAAAQPDGAGHPLGRRDLGRRPGRRRLALGRPPAGRCRRCRHHRLGPAGPGRLARHRARPPAPAGRPAAARRRARGCGRSSCVRGAAPARSRRGRGRGSEAELPVRRPPAAARHGGGGRRADAAAAGAASASPARRPSPCRSCPDTGFELPGLDLLAPVKADDLPRPVAAGAGRDLAPARDRARRFRRARRDHRRQDRAGGHALRAGAGARHAGRAGHQPRRRHRPLAVRAVGARRRGAGPQRDRHRAAQRAPRHGLPARAAGGRTPTPAAAPACRWRWARTSPASRSSPTSPACRIC